MRRIQANRAPNDLAFARTILSRDKEGHTPLHLVVTNGHTAAVRALLTSLHIHEGAIEMMDEMNLYATLAKLTNIALRANFSEIAQLLLATRYCDVNAQTDNGETALFIAARAGRRDYVEMLIRSRGLHDLDLNLPNNGYSWTPLIVACVQGNQSVVEALLDAGADQSLCDAFGWTARDHTAFRGFWQIGKLLSPTPQHSTARIPKMPLLETNPLPPCNAGETRIFVNIGTLDTRQPRPAVDLQFYLAKFPHNPYPDVGFSIKVSVIGATGSTDPITLPILSDATNYPTVFTTRDLEKVCLVFSVSKTQINSQDGSKIGGAVALLAELKNGLDPDRESLIRNYTVPILALETLEPIGTVTFDFLAVKPFPNPNTHPIDPRAIWNGAARPQVIGHRGTCLP